MIAIDSDYVIVNPEINFRVAAGPGAGKTHWLVNHMLSILRKPEKLGKIAKIACITYTNIGAETIVRRLGSASNRCEISTVHSFFYKNVVKPYLAFIAEDIGIDVTKVDGHDDYIISDYSFLQEFKKEIGQNYLKDNEALVKAISDLGWTREINGNVVLKLKPNKFPKIGKYSLKKTAYLTYKRMAWKRGVVHHDDVLYFTYQIFTNYPFLLNALKAKFPYFFVDEFQDSNPLQVEVFRLLSAQGIYVGIIGDVAQSIYGFNGASPMDFTSFNAPGIIEYIMLQNRRSSNEIIAALNFVRKDLTQVPLRNKSISLPLILVGTMNNALSHARVICLEEPLITLSRDNATANLMRRNGVAPQHSGNLITKMISYDSTTVRREMVASFVRAIEFSRQSNFGNALKEMTKALRNCVPESAIEKRKVEILLELLKIHSVYEKYSLLKFINFLRADFSLKITAVSSGKPKEFYEKYTYSDLASCVNVADDYSENRTIHKAKGDEFDNVLLFLGKTNMLDLLFMPKLLEPGAEEQRVIYVGMSRARNRLFISVPELSKVQRGKLQPAFSVVDVG